jgi:TonB family protein
LRNRIALSALDGKNVPADTQGFVAKFVRAQLDREGMSLVRDAFPVDFAGKHFFREDYKESSGAGVAYKAFVCIKFRDYFLGWTVATGSPSELEKSLHLLEPIQFLDEPISPSDAGGLPGTVPGDPPKGIVAGVINSDPRQSPSGRPLRVRVSQGVSQGLCVKRVNPQYPEEARHGRIQGQVVLQVEIDKNGDMKNVTLVSGHPLLAAAAMEAVKQWKYKPYLLEGQPVAVDTQVIVNFTLSGG